ncbi:phytosulfokines 3-like [Quercus suber]|uniref:phytosulfokines 3-like n=1 Tax=Quercus suber TaxID=58331 RepID=UPI000CE24238|nr:phytosulfokines 3-like isoform X1 [Quercus suber]XP_023918625.1 phytosulfokines 3-like isoform X1 [Quercus suber]POF02711.1 phytosulfokines 3 [Quercus suber]
MARCFASLFLVLLLLSSARARPLSFTTTTRPESNLHIPEESSIVDGSCKGIGSEECLIRRSMLAHTDYIYTQAVKGP